MEKNYKIQWKESPTDKYTYRTKVIGGWLVNISLINGAGVTFVPDKDHQWDWEDK